MKDEIKEHIQNCIDREESCLLNSDNAKILLDYITNLEQEKFDLENRLDNEVATCLLIRQENKRLKQMVDWNDKVANKKQKVIDKAIDYIQEKYDEDLYDDTLTAFENELLNILTGGDE